MELEVMDGFNFELGRTLANAYILVFILVLFCIWLNAMLVYILW